MGASIDYEAAPSKSLVVHCLQMSGETIATLRMDPSNATVVQVAAVLDKVGTRVGLDHNVYSLADFVEHYGEDEGFQIWCDREVRIAADLNTHLSAYSHEEFMQHYFDRLTCPSGDQEWRAARRLASSVQFVLPNAT